MTVSDNSGQGFNNFKRNKRIPERKRRDNMRLSEIML